MSRAPCSKLNDATQNVLVAEHDFSCGVCVQSRTLSVDYLAFAQTLVGKNSKVLGLRTLEFLPARVWAAFAQTLVGEKSKVLGLRSRQHCCDAHERRMKSRTGT